MMWSRSSSHMTKVETEWLPGQVERSSAHIHIQVMLGQRPTPFLQIVPGVLVQVRVLKQIPKSNKTPFLLAGVLVQLNSIRITLPTTASRRRVHTVLYLPVVPHCSGRRCHPWLSDSTCDWLQQPGDLCRSHSLCSLHLWLCEARAHWGIGIELISVSSIFLSSVFLLLSNLSSSLKSQNFLSEVPLRDAGFSLSITQEAVRVRGS